MEVGRTHLIPENFDPHDQSFRKSHRLDCSTVLRASLQPRASPIIIHTAQTESTVNNLPRTNTSFHTAGALTLECTVHVCTTRIYPQGIKSSKLQV